MLGSSRREMNQVGIGSVYGVVIADRRGVRASRQAEILCLHCSSILLTRRALFLPSTQQGVGVRTAQGFRRSQGVGAHANVLKQNRDNKHIVCSLKVLQRHIRTSHPAPSSCTRDHVYRTSSYSNLAYLLFVVCPYTCLRETSYY